MKKYIFTTHAKKRMAERDIAEYLVKDAIEHPTKISHDAKGRILFKKLYQRGGKRLLLIAGEIEEDNDVLKIITVIDTSKVKKYL